MQRHIPSFHKLDIVVATGSIGTPFVTHLVLINHFPQFFGISLKHSRMESCRCYQSLKISLHTVGINSCSFPIMQPSTGIF